MKCQDVFRVPLLTRTEAHYSVYKSKPPDHF